MSLTAKQLLDDQTFVALARRIISGRCALFVGAGASLSSGAPKTQQLADLIAQEILQVETPSYPLAEIVDYTDGSVGREPVTRFIVNALRDLLPSAALCSLTSHPWTSIFSTNYDDLIEKALESNGIPVQFVLLFLTP